MTPAGSGQWRRLALPASLVFNLFLVALIAGHLLRGDADQASSELALTRDLANAEASLPPLEAAAFGTIMRRDSSHYAQSAQALTEARQALVRQLVVQNFDQAGARQALAAWREARSRFIEDIGDTLVEALAQVSPEGRRQLLADRRSARVGPAS
jgi:uncharacterized membrane protein